MSSKKGVIAEDSCPVIFSSCPILFSSLSEQRLGLELKWEAWNPRLIELRTDGTLVIRDQVTSNSKIILAKFDLNSLIATQMSYRVEAIPNPLSQSEIGMLYEVKTTGGHSTQIRMIFSETERQKFHESLRKICPHHNLDNIRNASITNHVNKWNDASRYSIMRSAVACAMDSFHTESVKERIKTKRGAFKWLPVYFANDLVHGSWWFVGGSILFAVSSAVILSNSFSPEMGNDDSILNSHQYRASWLLMTISGIFFTLGSLAFVRAVHEDPPMKPLFRFYHFQSDELLGSWLFFFGTLPIIPYSLIYLAASHDNLEYLGALFVSILLVIGTLLFVRACYPSDQERRVRIIQPLVNCLCGCFCSRKWRQIHLSNDWLAGTWFIFWGTFVAQIVCFALLFMAIAESDALLMFMYGTGFIETLCFLIGSAYFVAGSYPESSEITNEQMEPESSCCIQWGKKNGAKPPLSTPFLESTDF